MLEKRKQLEKIEKMKQTQQRIQEIELQKEEQRLISELAQRTPISAEEAELCKMYEEALELENCENLNEEKLIELAQKIGMDYNSLKKRIKA
ncbi:hypothetical protein TRFO_33855 [Tritrichomonas foetus]|uniref:Uncharacterized protein n=1 Tax=Tritrichomonas foetus TaxID=1144522 RepID=A0A1J4JKJ1_9EUKA|nr:hypothetical protein TRFO_33855 [Tritrichomonas foetus]|eukprot:OHS99626.1 hypothetical protein TRFO_33855 [Tritrichomonas foetus]